MSDLSFHNDDSFAIARDSAFDRVPRMIAGFEDLAPDLAGLGLVRRASRGTGLSRGNPARPGIGFVVSGVAFLTHAPTGLCMAPVSAGQTLGAAGLSGVWMTDGERLDIAFDAMISHYGAETALAIYARAEAQARAAVEAELACALSHRAGPRFARWILRLVEAQPVILLNQAELARLSGLQRTSVCAAMATLQDTGGIKVMRGRIDVRDVAAVERLACTCRASGLGSHVEPSACADSTVTSLTSRNGSSN